ncbi:MAG: glycosyltransferase [Oligoflexia bacterium]|nr:glycosyltransferase [Oligoflexia bacterium]
MFAFALIILGATFLFCVLGALSLILSAAARRPPAVSPADKPQALKISILIPAHNEEKKIGVTLESLASEIPGSGATVEVILALDRCTDATEQAAQAWASKLPLRMISVDYGSKWKTLQRLFRESSQDSAWAVLLDAGTIWEAGFLGNLCRAIRFNPDAGVLGPGYRMHGGSFVTRLFWGYERFVKACENRLGGPISLHGATIAFRRDVLEKIWRELGSEKYPIGFQNDDIALPLAARIFFPELRNIYLKNLFVFDRMSHERLSLDARFRRRKRMVLGNLQWTRWFLRVTPRGPLISCLALRRMLRPFWVIGLIVFAAGVSLESRIGLVFLAPILIFPSAAIASAYAPIAWLGRFDEKPAKWR